MDIKDVLAQIKDEVSKTAYDAALKGFQDGEEKRRKTEEANPTVSPDQIVQKLIQAAGQPQAKGFDPKTGRDAAQGKGLDFVRALACVAIGQKEHKDPIEVAKRAGRTFDRVAKAFESMPSRQAQAVERALSEQQLTDGGVLVPETLSSEFIELLYGRTVVDSMGARSIDFKGSLQLGRLNSSATAYHVGENVNVSPSQPGLGAVTLQAKKVMGLVPVSNDLIRNPSAGALAIVRDDLLKVMALAMDLQKIRGLGTEYAPRGILNWTTSGNKFNQAGTTLANVVSDCCKAIRLVEESNVGFASPGWLFAPRTKWGFASIVDGTGHFVFLDQIAAGNLFGYKFGVTTQIPTNLNTNQSETYFGEFSECISGTDTALEVDVFKGGAYYDGSGITSGISADQTVMSAVTRYDFAMRHSNTFSVIQQVTLS
jgi:HK97 family phage major capsid protein